MVYLAQIINAFIGLLTWFGDRGAPGRAKLLLRKSPFALLFLGVLFPDELGGEC
jgi:hypothetical protein